MAIEQAMDVVTPNGSDFLTIGIAFVVYFLFSFLWWGPIFGKKWGALMGINMNEKPSMAIPMALAVLGTAFLSYVLWYVMETMAVTVEGGALVRGDLALGAALTGGFFTWLGFFVPVQLGRVSWEKAPWALFGINAGGHLVALLLMSIVFAMM